MGRGRFEGGRESGDLFFFLDCVFYRKNNTSGNVFGEKLLVFVGTSCVSFNGNTGIFGWGGETFCFLRENWGAPMVFGGLEKNGGFWMKLQIRYLGFSAIQYSWFAIL